MAARLRLPSTSKGGWSEEGADTGIEEPDTLLAQHKLSSPLDEMGYVLDTIKLQARDWSRYVTSQLDTS